MGATRFIDTKQAVLIDEASCRSRGMIFKVDISHVRGIKISSILDEVRDNEACAGFFEYPTVGILMFSDEDTAFYAKLLT